MKRIKIENIKNQNLFISINPKQHLDSYNNKITKTHVIFFQEISQINKMIRI